MKDNYTFSFIDLSELTRKDFNKNFIARFYPDSKNTHDNSLIGYDKLMRLFITKNQKQRIIKQIINLKKEKLDIRFKRGVRLTIIQR